MVSLLELPTEVLLGIISYLDCSSFYNFARVCSYINHLTQDPNMIRQIKRSLIEEHIIHPIKGEMMIYQQNQKQYGRTHFLFPQLNSFSTDILFFYEQRNSKVTKKLRETTLQKWVEFCTSGLTLSENHHEILFIIYRFFMKPNELLWMFWSRIEQTLKLSNLSKNSSQDTTELEILIQVTLELIQVWITIDPEWKLSEEANQKIQTIKPQCCKSSGAQKELENSFPDSTIRIVDQILLHREFHQFLWELSRIKIPGNFLKVLIEQTEQVLCGIQISPGVGRKFLDLNKFPQWRHASLLDLPTEDIVVCLSQEFSLRIRSLTISEMIRWVIEPEENQNSTLALNIRFWNQLVHSFAYSIFQLGDSIDLRTIMLEKLIDIAYQSITNDGSFVNFQLGFLLISALKKPEIQSMNSVFSNFREKFSGNSSTSVTQLLENWNGIANNSGLLNCSPVEKLDFLLEIFSGDSDFKVYRTICGKCNKSLFPIMKVVMNDLETLHRHHGAHIHLENPHSTVALVSIAKFQAMIPTCQFLIRTLQGFSEVKFVELELMTFPRILNLFQAPPGWKPECAVGLDFSYRSLAYGLHESPAEDFFLNLSEEFGGHPEFLELVPPLQEHEIVLPFTGEISQEILPDLIWFVTVPRELGRVCTSLVPLPSYSIHGKALRELVSRFDSVQEAWNTALQIWQDVPGRLESFRLKIVIPIQIRVLLFLKEWIRAWKRKKRSRLRGKHLFKSEIRTLLFDFKLRASMNCLFYERLLEFLTPDLFVFNNGTITKR